MHEFAFIIENLEFIDKLKESSVSHQEVAL